MKMRAGCAPIISTVNAFLGSARDDGKRRLGGDKLPELLKKELAQYFDFDLSEVTIHHYIPMGPYLAADPDGYTFSHDIYFKNYDPSTEKGFKDLLHELAHVSQFKNLGIPGFVVEYCRQFKRNYFDRGLSWNAAYFNMALEEDARSQAAEVLKAILAENYGNIRCS